MLSVAAAAPESFASFSQAAAKNAPDLFTWTDTCNVYVLRDGDAALLINIGDGTVLEHLSEIGVKRIEWLLFTNHHREHEPYRATLNPGEPTDVTLHVRNFRARSQRHRIEIHTPAGLHAEPAMLEGTLAAESRQSFPIRLQASADAGSGVRLVAFDVTLDGRRYGERFDMILNVNSATNVYRSKP